MRSRNGFSSVRLDPETFFCLLSLKYIVLGLGLGLEVLQGSTAIPKRIVHRSLRSRDVFSASYPEKHRPRVRVRTATGVDCDPETDSPAFVSIPKHFSASYPEIHRPRVRVRSAAGVDCDCETDSPAFVSIPKHFSTFYPVNTSSYGWG